MRSGKTSPIDVDTNIGLYYPHIEFQSDAWLKLAALYWDKVGRIVPRGYTPSDSPIVQSLREDLDFVFDIQPGPDDVVPVGEMFLELLKSEPGLCEAAYSLKRTGESSSPLNSSVGPAELLWNPPPDGVHPHPNHLVYLSIQKVSDSLASALVNAELGVIGPGDRIAVHPRLAYAYVQELAKSIASQEKFEPVTDIAVSHVAGAHDLVSLTAAIAGAHDVAVESTEADSLRHRLVTLALESVVPADLDSVPIQKIIRLRRRHEAEFDAFQHYVNDLCTRVGQLGDVSVRGLRQHVDVLYRKNVGAALNDLKRAMHAERVDTLTGAMHIRVALPPLLASTAALLGVATSGQLFFGGGAMVLATVEYLVRRHRARSSLVRTSPVGFLLLTETSLRPSRLTTLANRDFRRICP